MSVDNGYPSTEEINRNRLMDACLDAVGDYGLDSLQMNHVIEGSGLSRRTVYRYFGNKSELVQAAYLREGARMFEATQKAVVDCQTLEDIFVTAFLYVYQHLPQNPLLNTLINGHEVLLQNLDVERSVLETLQGYDLVEMFEQYPREGGDIYELSEYWIHAILSFLLLRSGENMSMAEVEAYVRKRFVPGLHLQQE